MGLAFSFKFFNKGGGLDPFGNCLMILHKGFQEKLVGTDLEFDFRILFSYD